MCHISCRFSMMIEISIDPFSEHPDAVKLVKNTKPYQFSALFGQFYRYSRGNFIRRGAHIDRFEKLVPCVIDCKVWSRSSERGLATANIMENDSFLLDRYSTPEAGVGDISVGAGRFYSNKCRNGVDNDQNYMNCTRICREVVVRFASDLE